MFWKLFEVKEDGKEVYVVGSMECYLDVVVSGPDAGKITVLELLSTSDREKLVEEAKKLARSKGVI
jgi:hypothetical protein